MTNSTGSFGLLRGPLRAGLSRFPRPSYGLDTRVMAAWRAAQSTKPGFWDMTLLVRGLIVAGLIMAVSFWPVLNSTETSESTANPFAEYLQLTDSTIPSDDAP